MKNYNYLPASLFIFIASFLISCGPSREASYWDVIDQNSVFVFETIHSPSVPEKSIIPFLKVSSTSFVIALQSISKSDFELIYSYVLPEKEYALLLGNKEMVSVNQKITSRLYNGFEIKEIRNKENEVQLAFAFLKGVFVLSKSSLLIENAIRTYELREGVNFRTSNKILFQFASVKSDAGNLYINYSQLYQSALMNSSLKESIPLLKDFAKSCMLDVKVDEDFISMNGFTLDSVKKNPGLSRFQSQKAVKFEVARFIPNYSTSLIHYGISNIESFLKSTNTSNSLKLNFGDEIAVCFPEQDSKGALIFVEINDKDISSFDTGEYFESYSGYEIKSFNGKTISAHFNQLIPSDSLQFFTFNENFIFVSQEVVNLKRLIDAIETDDTWGKSLSFQQFYDRGLQESNVSLFFRDPSGLDTGILKKWKPLIDSLHLSSISWTSLQFSALDKKFYTSVNIGIKPKEKETRQTKQRVEASSFRLPNSSAKAFIVKNHITSNNELILQDSTFKFYLFSPDNGILWHYQVDGMIQNVHQFDYFKNGKLQYFINTPESLYIIDRLGRDVQGFPKKLSSTLVFSDVVDYDKSRNYRLLVSSLNKEIFILDKDAKPLEGWSPKRLSGLITEAPKHYRIGGKDYFLAVSNGDLFHLFTRRGDRQAGFPISLKPYSGDYFLETGTNLANSYIYIISQDGSVTKQSLDGKAKAQENLLRGVNSKFHLVKTRDGKSDFYFVRIDSDKIAVFNKTNQLIIEKQNPGSTTLRPSVIVASKDKVIFSFFDEEQKMSYSFDQSGNSVINRPLESTIPPLFAIDNKTKRIVIYSFYENMIEMTPLN